MSEEKGRIFNIQRFSFHDGAGVRTIIFLKGCSLRCKWCANPESQNIGVDLFYKESSCIHCGLCVASCGQGALVQTADMAIVRKSDLCARCGACAECCPTGATECVGQAYTVEEVLEKIHCDDVFYRRSGGGVTLSGGEPLLQIDFVEALMKRLHAQGTDIAVETCGQVPGENIDRVLPYVSQFLFDVKHTDTEKHTEATGAGNEQILKNLRRIRQMNGSVIIRVPVIPGFNDNFETIGAICTLANDLGIEALHLLPYHDYARTKYQYLNRAYPMGDVKRMTLESLDVFVDYAAGFGLHVQKGG